MHFEEIHMDEIWIFINLIRMINTDYDLNFIKKYFKIGNYM